MNSVGENNATKSSGTLQCLYCTATEFSFRCNDTLFILSHKPDFSFNAYLACTRQIILAVDCHRSSSN